MAASMKRWNRIGELVARLRDRQRGEHGPRPTIPVRSNRDEPVSRTPDGRTIARILSGVRETSRRKIAAYQARGWGRQETARSARPPEGTLRPAAIADQEPRNARALTPSLRSSRSTWADRWQR